MVEVFKTNVRRRNIANRIIERIHKEFSQCRANFDLTDVDRILRIKCDNSMPETNAIIQLVASEGFEAEVLPDEPASGRIPDYGTSMRRAFKLPHDRSSHHNPTNKFIWKQTSRSSWLKLIKPWSGQ